MKNPAVELGFLCYYKLFRSEMNEGCLFRACSKKV